ncbi:hypothetical protein MBLNU459_g3662t1 [Dothideomycetes sp. NU459]
MRCSPILFTLFAALVAAEGSGSGEMAESPADIENVRISWYLGYVWAATVAAIFIYNIWLTSVRYVRTLACLGNENQRYFSYPNSTYASIKRHILDAPLFRKRHNREFKLSAAVNVGTLPGRLQTMYLIGYIGMNIAFCVISIDWSSKPKVLASEIRNRTGVLAVMNMLPLFVLAGRNNPFITLLGISFDTYNLMHRWIGRIVVLEALAHTLAWTVNTVQTAGWAVVGKAMAGSQLILTGTIGTCAMLAILLMSPSVFRHAFYETFLHIHILLAALAVGAVWIHLKDLRQQVILLGVIVIWVAERAQRLYSIIRNNVGRGGTKAQIEALPGDAIRITLRIARPWTFRPGQHIYLYLPSIGMWTSHPFSLAWSDEEQKPDAEKGLSMDRHDVLSRQKTTMSLIIRRRTGFTEQLWRKAERSPEGMFVSNAIVEGPYGRQSLESYGHVMLFAAGVGITHQVPHARELVRSYANDSCATRRVVLVWIIQSPEHLEWIRPWMTEILGLEKRREVLKIMLFVTRPRSTKEIHSPSASVQMFPGKPDVGALISQEQAKQVGTMAVSVCGTGSLGDDVRRAVRERSEMTAIDFSEESFSW